MSFRDNVSEWSFSPRAEYGYLKGLDGLRAFAVLLVIAAHTGLTHILPGGFGVTVFFFISGFLITRLLLAETEKNGYVDLGKFYIRRFLRLLPALFLMVGLTFIITAAFNDGQSLASVIAALAYYMNYQNIMIEFSGQARTGPWNHLWSLAVEEHFYLLFPLLMLAFSKKLDFIIKACLVLCGLALVWRLISFYGLNFPEKYNYFATEARMDSILYGCLLSLMMHKLPNGIWRKFLIGWIPTIMAALVLIACFVIRDDGFRQTFRYSLQGMALFVAIINLYMHRPLQFCLNILELSALRWIGRVSYGLYLWHIPCMYMTDNYLGYAEGSAAFVIIAVVMTFIFTSLSFYGVEQPFVGLRKRFGAHIVTAPVQPKSSSFIKKIHS